MVEPGFGPAAELPSTWLRTGLLVWQKDPTTDALFETHHSHFHPGQPHSIVLTPAMEGWPNSPGSDKVHHGFERQPGWPTCRRWGRWNRFIFSADCCFSSLKVEEKCIPDCCRWEQLRGDDGCPIENVGCVANTLLTRGL